MSKIRQAAGESAFKKNNRFSLAMFEFVSNGTSKALENSADVDLAWLKKKIEEAPTLPAMDRYSGSGVRGTQRLSGLVPEAPRHFA